MIKTAEDILNIVKEEKNVSKSFEATSFDEAVIKLISEYKNLAQNDNLVSVVVNIDGGIDNNGVSLSLESNFINLPLRYKNQLAKLIYASELEINTYLIIEEVNITKSNLFIDYLDTVDNFLNDQNDYESMIKTIYQNLKQKEEVSEKSE